MATIADLARRAHVMAQAQRVATAMRQPRIVFENTLLPEEQKYGFCSPTMFEAANRARVEDHGEPPLIFISECQPITERTDFDYIPTPGIVL